MTKRELERLHSSKCVVSEVDWQSGRGLEKRLVVSFSLTRLELIDVVEALAQKEGIGDLDRDLRNAVVRSGVQL